MLEARRQRKISHVCGKVFSNLDAYTQVSVNVWKDKGNSRHRRSQKLYCLHKKLLGTDPSGQGRELRKRRRRLNRQTRPNAGNGWRAFSGLQPGQAARATPAGRSGEGCTTGAGGDEAGKTTECKCRLRGGSERTGEDLTLTSNRLQECKAKSEAIISSKEDTQVGVRGEVIVVQYLAQLGLADVVMATEILNTDGNTVWTVRGTQVWEGGGRAQEGQLLIFTGEVGG